MLLLEAPGWFAGFLAPEPVCVEESVAEVPIAQDPASCGHARISRLGVMRFDLPPYRVYLVNCAACGGTYSTRTLRLKSRASRLPPLGMDQK